MNKDNGGPAFPSHGTMGEVVSEGMTLRDYFAAKFLPNIYAEHVYDLRKGKPFSTTWASEISEEAYKIADAMMEARKQ